MKIELFLLAMVSAAPAGKRAIINEHGCFGCQNGTWNGAWNGGESYDYSSDYHGPSYNFTKEFSDYYHAFILSIIIPMSL